MTEHPTSRDLADEMAALAGDLEQLRASFEDTRARLDNVQLDLADVVQLLESAGPRTASADTVYTDWHTWTVRWLEPRISRGQHHRWCPKLDEHLEVEMRLEAVWQAWESIWPKPALRAGWLRDCLDPQLAALTASDGPLRRCSAPERQHVVPVDLRYDPPGTPQAPG